MRADWQSVMNAEEKDEFGAIDKALKHAQEAAKALSLRRAKIRNRLVMRLNWRKKHVGEK